jgi:hypothetical protein
MRTVSLLSIGTVKRNRTSSWRESGSHALVARFLAVRRANDLFPPPLYQALLTDFIQAGHFARHVCIEGTGIEGPRQPPFVQPLHVRDISFGDYFVLKLHHGWFIVRGPSKLLPSGGSVGSSITVEEQTALKGRTGR